MKLKVACLWLLLMFVFPLIKSASWSEATPPNRTLPAELIVLENGSTTFVSASLEEFLESPSTTTTLKPEAAAQESKNQTTHQEEQKQQNFFEKAVSSHAAQAAAPTNATTPKPIPQHWQVKSLLNVTHDYPLEYSQIICGYVWPLMAAITLFTNLMIVFVLTQRDMRTPTNVVLTAIAIADIIPIVVPVPWFVYLFAMGNEKQVLYPPIACYFYQHSTRSVSEIFYFLSTWLNVLLAVQDYLTACWPKLAKKYCQIRVVIIEIVVLTLLAFLLNLPQALKLVFKPVKFYYQGELTWGCRALQAKWFKDLVGEYVALYDDIFTAIIVLFVDGGPAIVLITLTALLIRQLHRQRIQGHLLMEQARTASKRRRERHRQQEYEASARVMIFVLLAFLAVKIPFATTYTLMIIQSRFEIHFVENLVDFQKAITLTDLVFVLSYPINFTIFCGCSKKFRHKCAQLLGECNQNTKSAKNRLMSSFSSSFNSDNTTTAMHLPGDRSLAGDRDQQDKRDSLATMMSAKRDSSVSLLMNLDGRRSYLNNKRDSLTTTGALVCCNGTAGGPNSQKLSQPPPSPGDHSQDQQRRQSQQQQHRGMMPSPIFEVSSSLESIRASLAEDGLCVECIMRYEQMKRSSGSIAAASYLSGSQHHHQPRLSTDSGSSWSNVPMPPPPPPLQYCLGQQQQLPHIVTTRCESIRERSSSEELNQTTGELSNVCVAIGGEPHELLPQHKHQQQQQQRSASMVEGPEVEPGPSGAAHDPQGRGRIQARQVNGSAMRGSSDPGTVRGPIGLSYNHLNQYNLQQRGDISYSQESVSSGGGSGGPGDGHGDGRRDEEERRSRAARGGLRAPTLKQIENKHRSLSMSNSKLSALAGATGLLADIIKSTLLTTNPSAAGSTTSSHRH